MLVLDATVVINLGNVRALWILRESTDTDRVVVDEVANEIRRPPATIELRQALEERWIRRHRLSTHDEFAWLATVRRQHPRLGAGESASLAACIANSWVFASDDRRARRVAAALEPIPVGMTGTVTILLNAVQLRVIDWATAERLYARMIVHGFRAPFAHLKDALDPL